MANLSQRAKRLIGRAKSQGLTPVFWALSSDDHKEIVQQVQERLPAGVKVNTIDTFCEVVVNLTILSRSFLVCRDRRGRTKNLYL